VYRPHPNPETKPSPSPQVRLASVRRSLFTNETERAKFLNHLAGGTLELLRTQQGLADHANYHEFCRLLGRLKTNYQLSELVWFRPACAQRLSSVSLGWRLRMRAVLRIHPDRHHP